MSDLKLSLAKGFIPFEISKGIVILNIGGVGSKATKQRLSEESLLSFI